MKAIAVRNAQRTVKVFVPGLQRFAEIALQLAQENQRKNANCKAAILVVIVSDRTMAGLHRQFSNISGPTDVLTFQHGEIVISAETARRQARRFHTSPEFELRLYLLHGLLHLAGFDDSTARTRAGMQKMQRRLLHIARRREGGTV